MHMKDTDVTSFEKKSGAGVKQRDVENNSFLVKYNFIFVPRENIRNRILLNVHYTNIGKFTAKKLIMAAARKNYVWPHY